MKIKLTKMKSFVLFYWQLFFKDSGPGWDCAINDALTQNPGPDCKDPGRIREIHCPAQDKKRELEGTDPCCNAATLPFKNYGSSNDGSRLANCVRGSISVEDIEGMAVHTIRSAFLYTLEILDWDENGTVFSSV